MQDISWIDISVIAVYLLLMIGVGIWFQRKIKNLDDYALAGNPWATSMIGTLVGAPSGRPPHGQGRKSL